MLLLASDGKESPPPHRCKGFHWKLANASFWRVVPCVCQTLYTRLAVGWRSLACYNRFTTSRPSPSNRVGWTIRGKGRFGGLRRDSPAIDSFSPHSIANLLFIHTFPRFVSSTGLVPDLVRFRSAFPFLPLASSVSLRGGPPSRSWRPRIGGARPEHVDTIATTSTWIVRLLRAPTGQDGACEALRSTFWKVDWTWMGWEGVDGEKEPRGTTVVGKHKGEEASERGQVDGTSTCLGKRRRWSLERARSKGIGGCEEAHAV